jgi:hypothetical protein
MTKTPRSLREEHEELRQFVHRLGRADSEVGDAARRLERLLETHMQKEENFAAPPLGLLPRLARGDFGPAMADTLAHTDWMKRNLDVMHAEHQMIAGAVEELLKAAGAKAPAEMVTFAEKLLNHARLEEEVLYPAAIVVGEYLKLKLAERASITIT